MVGFVGLIFIYSATPDKGVKLKLTKACMSNISRRLRF